MLIHTLLHTSNATLHESENEFVANSTENLNNKIGFDIQ